MSALLTTTLVNQLFLKPFAGKKFEHQNFFWFALYLDVKIEHTIPVDKSTKLPMCLQTRGM